ncbi:PQQ-binding-like beta-propeller repeat protein [Verrucomicrobiota bacterium]
MAAPGPRQTHLAASCVLATVCLAGAGDGARWMQWHGPSADNVSSETGLLKTWPEGGPKLLWTATNCGVGFSSVTISDGLIITAGDFPDGTRVIALDADGKDVWRASNGSRMWRHPKKKEWANKHAGSRATPVIDDGRVFHMNAVGRLAAYKLANGTRAWTVDLRQRFGGVCNEWGYSESVLVRNRRVYCVPGGKNGYMVALDAKTGETAWANKTIKDKASNSHIVRVEIEGVGQLVTMTTVLVVGVREEDGELLWSIRHANRFRENCEAPRLVDGIIYVSSGYRHGSEGLKVTKNETGKFSCRQVWRNSAADNLHGGPIILDGHVYATGYDRKGFFCLDLQTGREKWRNRAIGRTSFTSAEGLLYCLGEDGTVRLVEPSPEKYIELGKFRLPSAGKGICLAHMVICGKRLYVRHGTKLYCYDIARK